MGSRNSTLASVFRANLDDGGARLFAGRFMGSFRAVPDGDAARRSTKRQAPSSRETPSTKHQVPDCKPRCLELGIWNFFGAWSLAFGAFAAASRVSVHPSPYSLRCANPPPARVPSEARPR